MSRWARRVDSNHAEVVGWFEDLHCSVINVSRTPCGFDLVVGYGGLSICVEVKDGKKSPSRRKLSDTEKKVHDRWTGGARIVKDMQDVITTVQTLQLWARTLQQHLSQQRKEAA